MTKLHIFVSAFEYDEHLIARGTGASAVSSETSSVPREAASTVDSVSMQAVLERITTIATLSPTELSNEMSTEQGSALARFESESAEPEGLLRPWNSIGRASPSQLSEEQYETFLSGQHPIADTDELYGAHLAPKKPST